MKLTRAFLIDAGERVASTGAQAFLAAFGIEGFLALAGGDWQTAATFAHSGEIAGLGAALAAVKALFAASKPGTVSPASLAPSNNGRKATGRRVEVLAERKVTGRRLGRHVEHDERSRAYAVQPVDAAALKSVRHTRRAKVFDQGDIGSCTGNACAGALSTAPFRHRFTERRALGLYEQATRLDDIAGQYPPDDTGSSGLAVAKAAQRDGLCSSYQHCFSPEAVYAALQTGPVIVGVSWLTGFDDPDKTGRMRYAGSSRGGHELCMDEIDVENRRVWVTNSWGVGWGVKGRAWWSWDDFARVMADSGDATVLVP